MCVPIIAGAMIAGSLVSAYGQYSAGKAAKDATDYNAKVAQNNALSAQLQAGAVADRAELQKRDIGLAAGQIRGKGRNAYAAGNVVLGPGSVFDWESTMDERKAQDISRVNTETADKQWALRNQALDYLNQADLTKMSGKSAMTAGMIGAGGSLLSGGGQAGYSYASLTKKPA